MLAYLATKYLSMALLVLMLLGFSAASAPGGLLRGSLFVFFAIIVVTLAYQILAVVGIWRSAKRFPGEVAYSVLARAAGSLYLAVFAGSVGAAVHIWSITHGA
jgi:hypothetical protein